MAARWHDNRNLTFIAIAGIAGLSFVLAAFLLGDGLRRARMAERSVTMRGLAERDVTADLASWTIAFSEEGTELGPVQAAMDDKSRAVHAFFDRFGFAKGEVADTGTSVNEMYDRDRMRNSVTVRQTVQLRTRDVAKARAAFARQADLIRGGVALADGSGMIYSFTQLNKIKPQMIAEATRSAREGAVQFARDSGTGIGGIKQATQGYFSIGARDGDVSEEGGSSAGDSPLQKVRVVTTIEFYVD